MKHFSFPSLLPCFLAGLVGSDGKSCKKKAYNKWCYYIRNKSDSKIILKKKVISKACSKGPPYIETHLDNFHLRKVHGAPSELRRAGSKSYWAPGGGAAGTLGTRFVSVDPNKPYQICLLLYRTRR